MKTLNFINSNKYKLVLATDLDGTFLEGDSRVKNFFYQELLRLKEYVALIYTTGRSAETVEQFCKRGYLPHPDFVIADHGTHIVEGATFNLVKELQEPIIRKWDNGNHYLRTLLKNDRGIQLQPIDPPYRVAYYYEPHILDKQTLDKITTAGYDVILSCDMYLDIVPQGVNKGTTLLNLLNHLGLQNESVITCGDSLNDLSLFETGLKSIAVGNSEPKLIEAIKSLENVYLSSFPGLYGIIDGMHFYRKDFLFNLKNFDFSMK